jgi:hypothetical protein
VKKVMLLVAGLLLLIATSADGYRSPRSCDGNPANDDTHCRCVLWHDFKESFCRDTSKMMPACCIATEKKSKFRLCRCCGYLIDIVKRGWVIYSHENVVEYQQ